MEFHEKLQKLRKSRSLTQEELAEALFVSRTAVSKWESGKGYPNIDSLKELARFFSVTIDELIGSDEIMLAAEHEKSAYVSKTTTLICCTLDLLTALLFVIPVFGNGAASPAPVSLFGMTAVRAWIRAVFAVILGVTVLNGVCGVILTSFEKPVWNRHRLITGVALSILGVCVFLMARQPYAGIVCFAFLVIKGFLIVKTK